jgi:DNA-3-methyladenine glycosylase I
VQRCPWAVREPNLTYHDTEWGVPVRDDRRLFELLTLEGAQAGLSWETILRKRDNYREAFADWEVERIARFTGRKVESLMRNPGIVRNRLKIEGTVRNARAFLEVQSAHGGFGSWIWPLAGDAPMQNRWTRLADVPARTAISDAMSKALKAAGFTFVGSTICYAFMQATGMVNDHLVSCFRHSTIEVRGLKGRDSALGTR